MIGRWRTLWNPGAYQGKGRRGVYFEGWYFKLVDRLGEERWALIPGIFRHPDPDRAHAFLQVLDGKTSRVVYHRYPIKDFQASSNTFNLRVGKSRFHAGGCRLDVDGQGQRISGEVRFGKLHPWPVRPLSPGVMGPYAFVPLMQTYHGVLSLDHTLEGSLTFDGRTVDFTDGRGYLEKDWGSTFPRAYVWMQTNHFQQQGVSLTASVATIPWLRSWFRGFLVGLLVDGELYRFTTYLGSSIRSLKVTDADLEFIIQGSSRSAPGPSYPGYLLTIHAIRRDGGTLSAPEMDGMTPRILESLTAEIQVHLQAIDPAGQPQKTLYQGTGSCAGLEVAGSVEEITESAASD